APGGATIGDLSRDSGSLGLGSMNRGAEPTQVEDDSAIRHRSCRSGAAVQPPGLSSPGRALEGATPGQVHRFEGPERTDRADRRQGPEWEGVRLLLSEPEQEARCGPEGNTVQPVRDRHGEAG